jgi:hypothetical protein
MSHLATAFLGLLQRGQVIPLDLTGLEADDGDLSLVSRQPHADKYCPDGQICSIRCGIFRELGSSFWIHPLRFCFAESVQGQGSPA